MKNIKNYKTISTSNGDQGMSRNYSNELIPKTDILFDTLGNIDELSSVLGLAYHFVSFKEEIRIIQTKLQHINSVIATTDERRLKTLVRITEEDVKALESIEQQLLDDTVIKPVFVLPGSDTTKEGAYLDVARSVARRAERYLVRFADETVRNLTNEKKYINRLSDLLFIMTRYLSEKEI